MTTKICDFCGNKIHKGAPNCMPKAYEIVWGYDGMNVLKGKNKMDICPTCWKDMHDYVTIIQEKRVDNKAFLHGKEYGLSTGRNVAIDQALEIIEGFLELRLYLGDRAVYHILDVDGLKDAVLALKGGEQG